MYRHAKLTALATMAMFATAVYGQKAIPDLNQAYETFSRQLEKEDLKVSESTNSQGKAFSQWKTFAIPKKKSRCLEVFRNTLVANGPISYTSYSLKAGAKATDDGMETQPIMISRGENDHTNLIFGTDSCYNYELRALRDTKDSTMRYIYALKWRTSGGITKGTVYKFYGKDPKKGRRGYTFAYGDLSSLRSLRQLDSLGSRLKSLRALDSLDWGRNRKVYMYNSDENITSGEFLKRLSNLRTALKTAKGKGDSAEKTLTLQTGVVNKIVELCKKHGDVLSQQEVEFCKTALRGMKKEVSDSYLASLLDLMASTLGQNKQDK